MAKKTKKTGNKKARKTSSKRKVSHKGARAKGHQFEREVANAIGHIFPEARRKLEYQSGEIDGSDLDDCGPYRIQCKNHQGYVSVGTIKEVHAKKNQVPVLITKGNKLKPMVVMPFQDWVRLLEMAHGTVDMPLIVEGEVPAINFVEYDPDVIQERPVLNQHDKLTNTVINTNGKTHTDRNLKILKSFDLGYGVQNVYDNAEVEVDECVSSGADAWI